MEAVWQACVTGDVKSFMAAIADHGLTLWDLRSANYRALCLACEYGYPAIVLQLLDLGMPVCDMLVMDGAPLRMLCASEANTRRVLEKLLAAGLTEHALWGNDNFALNYACSYGQRDIVEYLIELGLTEAQVRSNNNCALRWAFDHGHVAICQLMMKHGAYLPHEVHHILSDNVDLTTFQVLVPAM